MTSNRWRKTSLRALVRGFRHGVESPGDHAPDAAQPGQERLPQALREAYSWLLQRLPSQIQGKARICRMDLCGKRTTVDMDELLTWLQLPRFLAGNPAWNWVRWYASAIPPGERLSLTRTLDQLMDLNAEPQARRLDVRFAAWELEFVGLAASTTPLPVVGTQKSDPILLMPPAQVVAEWTRLKTPACLAALKELSADGMSLGWNPRSVLSVVGYAVGWSGVPKSVRHDALLAAVVAPKTLLPTLHREWWGDAGTQRRKRVVVAMLDLFCKLAKGRTHGDWSRACSHWRSDVDWLNGVFAVSPRTNPPATPAERAKAVNEPVYHLVKGNQLKSTAGQRV